MPILLKNLLNEGVTVKVAGHSRSEELKHLYDLAQVINRKVMTPILNKIPQEDLTYKTHAPVLPDGSSYYETTGNINIYTGMVPDKWRPRIMGGISHLLQKLGVKTGQWELIGKEYQDDKKVVRIPIEYMPSSQDPAPYINMSGGALEKIKFLLDLGTQYDTENGSLTLSIDVDALRDYLDNYFENVEQGLAPVPPNPKVRQYLFELRKMIQWAKKHGHKTIVAR